MEKLKARAARFGGNVAPAMTSIEDDTKKKQREKKFGTVPVTSMEHGGSHIIYRREMDPRQVSTFFCIGQKADAISKVSVANVIHRRTF